MTILERFYSLGAFVLLYLLVLIAVYVFAAGLGLFPPLPDLIGNYLTASTETLPPLPERNPARL